MIFRQAGSGDMDLLKYFPWMRSCASLGDLTDFSTVPMIIGCFSLLLDGPIATSRSVSFSFDELAKLESCLRGMIESQSFSLWALTSVFTFLKDYGCVPKEDSFHQLIRVLL